MFEHAYPYTNMHEINLDYILNQMNQMDLDIQGIEARASATATESAKAYVNAQLVDIKASMTQLRNELNAGITDVYEVRDTLQSQYSAYTEDMNARFNLLQARVQEVSDHVDQSVIGCNTRTDLVVAQMHDQIMNEISDGLVGEKVRNYFTGGIMTVQDMFDYMCQTFHGQNGATITFITSTKQWTVNEMIALDHTCHDWITSGGTY